MTEPALPQGPLPEVDPVAEEVPLGVSVAAPPATSGGGVQKRTSLGVYVLKRLALIPVTILAVTSISFALVALLPGDTARAILGQQASPARIAQVNRELHLKQPLPVRYWDYLTGVAHGDLGQSFFGTKSVGTQIIERFPATLELILPALLMAVLLGGGIGTLGAYYSGRGRGTLARGVISLLQALPDFLIGAVLIFVFYSRLGMLPGPEGQLGFADTPPARRTGSLLIDTILAGQWGLLGSVLEHLVLPVCTLGLVYSAVFARTIRGPLATALNSESAHFARASGQSEPRIVLGAILMIRTTLMTTTALVFSTLVGASAVIEIVFSWPGLGSWGVGSMLSLDVPAVQGYVLVTGVATVVVYLILDVCSTLLDPRIRLGR